MTDVAERLSAALSPGGRLAVLWVCVGNICRSPVFAAALRSEATERGLSDVVLTDSAGVASWCAGRPPNARMASAAAHAGIQLPSRMSQHLSDVDLGRYDLVVPLSEDVLAALPSKVPTSKVVRPVDLGLLDWVPDPYGGSDELFKEVAVSARTAAERLCDLVRLRGGSESE